MYILDRFSLWDDKNVPSKICVLRHMSTVDRHHHGNIDVAEFNKS